ncbi:SagB/ThcOx family dehydrogenase [Rhizobium jaguaris]|nr:SagB/ThcOx family dehydrogenase [Rhizobium jaguaris]
MKQTASVGNFWFVQPDDLRTTLAGDYHGHSKITEFSVEFGTADPKKTQKTQKLIDAVAGHGHDFSFYPKIALDPLDWPSINVPLGQLLQARRSKRVFSEMPPSFRQISTLLARGAGPNGTLRMEGGVTRPLRTYPSGGGLYPLEVYVLVLSCEGIAPGLYHHDVDVSALTLLQEGDLSAKARSAFINDPMLNRTGIVILISAVFQRSSFKYGERSYRLVHLEAGHLVQNLILTGQAVGLSVVPVMGFVDRRIEDIIGVDGVEESILYCAAVGQAEHEEAV